MRDAMGRRLQLKSKLLVGAAGMAAAAMSTSAMAADAATAAATPAPAPTPTAAPIDAPKWLPYVDIGGGVGSGFSVGRAVAFVPAWQDLDSLLFVRLGFDTRTHYSANFNFGAGYRTKINPEWILGAFAGFDSSGTDHSHTFNQYSLGIEAMSEDWDLHANGYWADTKNRPNGQYTLFQSGTLIGILQGQEAALSGFDGEIGYRVYNNDTTDFRVFIGGYTFQHSAVKSAISGRSFNFDYHDVEGPKARAEVNIFDLDLLGPQSRLSIDGEVSHDDLHHTQEYIGATLRIPLGNPSGAGAQTLDELDRRMADPVRRQDNVLTQWNFNKPEPVVIYNGSITSQPTNTVYYVENRTSAGAGTYADKTTFKDAVGRGPVNQFVVLTDSGGSTIDTQGAPIQSGETVTGAGVFKIRGVDSGAVFTHDFAPGSGGVTLTSSTPHVVTMEGSSALGGVTIDGGPGGAAIYGYNVHDIQIADVKIIGGAGGIEFDEVDGGDANIDISDVNISGVTGSGIYLHVDDTGAGTNATLDISHSSISTGGFGVYANSTTTSGATSTVNLGVHDSTVSAGVIGIGAHGNVTAGSTLTQNIVVDPTTIDTHGLYGLYGLLIYAHTIGGTLNQTVDIADVTISGATEDGVQIVSKARGGDIHQTVHMHDVTTHGTITEVTSTYNNNTYTNYYGPAGIHVFAYADNGASVSQSVTMNSIIATGGLNGIYVHGGAYENSVLEQTVSVSHGTFDGSFFPNVRVSLDSTSGSTAVQYLNMSHIGASNTAHGPDVSIEEYAYNGGHALQHVGLSDLTATGSYAGLKITVGANDASDYSVAAQYVDISHADLSGNGISSVLLETEAGGSSAVRQDVSISASDLSHNGGYGIDASAEAGAAGTIQQSLSLTNDHLDYNGADGLSLSSHASGTSFIEQTFDAYKSTFDHNSQDGIRIDTAAADNGQIEQNVQLGYVSASYNGHNGIENSAESVGYLPGVAYLYYPHIEQNWLIGYSDFNHNGYAGFQGFNAALIGTMDQNFILYGDSLSNNALAGIDLLNLALYDAKFHQTVNLYTSHLDHNGSVGVFETSEASAYYPGGSFALPATMYTTLQMFGGTANYDGAAGILSLSQATGATYLIQTIYVGAGAHLEHNENGFMDRAEAHGYLSLNLQDITIANAHLDHNIDAGASIINVQSYGPFSFGYSTTNLNVANSSFSHNGLDGLYMKADSYDFQGRAEQHVNIQNSVFDYNGRDGALFIGTAHDGVYTPPSYNPATSSYNGGPCTNIVGLYGGCAFVRQTIDILGSDFSHNGENGIDVYNSANNYAAVYTKSGRPAHTPTLYIGYSTANNNAGDGLLVTDKASNNSYIYSNNVLISSDFSHNVGNGIDIQTTASSGSTVNQLDIIYGKTGYANTISHNGERGVNLSNNVTGASYLAQYNLVVGSSIDHNGTDGIYSASYVGGASKMLHILNVYSYTNPTSVAANGGHGIKSGVEALGGSQIIDYNTAYGINLSNNGGFGFDAAISYADSASAVRQINSIYQNKVNRNGDGIGLYSIGAGAAQYSYIGGNKVIGNAFVGVYGEANFGSFQYIGVHTFGNTVHSNGTDYLFNAFGGATQTLN